MLEEIPFNIWDDYHDDGYVPKDEIQETYGYVEEYDELNEVQRSEIIKVVYDYIQTLDMSGVEVKMCEERVSFKHLTHERREQLVDELEASDLQYNGIPFSFYSES